MDHAPASAVGPSDSGRRQPNRSGGKTLAVVTLGVLLSVGCTILDSRAPVRSQTPAGSVVTDRDTSAERPEQRTALAISVDGLRPAAVRRLGEDGAPTLHRLIRQGATTLNARTALEDTRTLPNHTSMITGRPVARRRDGHGVTVNSDPGGTVHDLAGKRVSSLFQVAARSGARPALFASKDKFALFHRSWRRSIDSFTYRPDSESLTGAVLRDLTTTERGVRFVHYAGPDAAGHEFGFASAEYLEAVRRVDDELGRLVRHVASRPPLRSHLVLVLTADHGGSGLDHYDTRSPDDFTVPFITWGAGVARGADLYRLNPGRRDPGHAQVGYRGPQPIRNGDLANLALDVLGLPAVPGSGLNSRQRLDLTPVRRPKE